MPSHSKIYQNRKIMELNFNSVEAIPVLNASAAFKTDSGKLFMSDYDMGDGGHVFRTC